MEGASAPPSAEKTSVNACLPCRKVKMRCRLVGNATTCERCARKSLDCTFRQHRRGRKPGVRLSSTTHRSGEFVFSPESADHGPPARTREQGTRESSLAPALSHRSREPDFWAESKSLQPSSLLSQQAMKGKFSLQNILSTNHGTETPSSRRKSTHSGDPVDMGLVDYSTAFSLYSDFMNHMNQYISHFDTSLHTFEYVQSKSPFLLTTILSAAAKAFNPSLYPSLHSHAEDLLSQVFRLGTKSPETVQAIMMLTYWKQPEDTRAWTSVGYAIRVCMDLGWHKVVPRALEETSMDEIKERETRNIERTWLVLFVYDRSMSLQTGKPWMIEHNEFIENIDSWTKSPLAIPSDNLLCAFVHYRLMAAEAFDLLNLRRQSYRASAQQSAQSLLRIIDNQVEECQNHWVRVTEKDPSCCYPFLIQFYANHLRLQLFSVPLQDSLFSLGSNLPSFQALWISQENAMEMLRLVSKYAPFLRLAQDSVHVMTAYAAVFLIKVLLSAPEAATRDLEPHSINVIREAAKAFRNLGTPASSSCALQAKFLDNVLNEYTSARQRHPPAEEQSAMRVRYTTEIPLAQQPLQLLPPPSSQPSISHNSNTLYYQPSANTTPSDPQPPSSIPMTPYPHPHQTVYNSTSPLGNPTAHMIQPAPSVRSGLGPPVPGRDTDMNDFPVSAMLDASHMPLQKSSEPNFYWADTNAYADLFATAGFNVQDGVFLPGNIQ